MTRRVKLQRREGVALITLPGAGAAGDPGFDPDLCMSLSGALDLALSEPGLRAIVLRAGAAAGVGLVAPAEGPSEGALSDIAGAIDAEPLVLAAPSPALGAWPHGDDPLAALLETRKGAPSVASLAQRLADAPVPVIALLSGRIAGAGLVIAQAASKRLAHPDTVFAAPEASLGLIPGGGALVRLARRAGGAEALAFLASARDWPAQEALGIGLCDGVSSGGALETAVLGVALEAAQAASTAGARGVPRGLANLPAYLAGLEEARDALAPALAAPGRGAALTRAVEVLEATALLPLGEALDFAQVAFDDLAREPASRGLRHCAGLRRAALRLAGAAAPDAPVDPLAALPRVALWNQSEHLALALIGRGHEVVIGTSDPGQLEPAFARIAALQEAAVVEGRLDPEAREADWGRLGAATDLRGLLAGAPEAPALAIATPQGAAETRVLMASRGPEGVLMLEGAFGTSSEAALHADIGAHRRGAFWELHGATDTGEAALPQVAALLRATGAEVVRGGAGAGTAAELEAALFLAAERAVLAGATPAAVDEAMRAFGFVEGPFQKIDARGLGSVAALLRSCGRGPGAYLTYLPLEGRVGRAGGIGVYVYPASGAVPHAPEDEGKLLAALRREAGITPRALSRSEIQARVLAELAGAGADALQAGRSHRAGDVDLAALAAIAFPAHRGGPMFQADEAGLIATRKRLRALAEEGAPAPVTLWDVMIRNGKHWADLNG